RVDGVDGAGGEADAAGIEHRGLGGALAYDDGFLAGEEAAEQRVGATGEVGGGALGDDAAAVGARTGSDLDDPRGLAQDLDVVVDEDHGVAVSKQVVHDAEQTLDVRGVQADRRLVEHVEDPGRAVTDGAGELDALALAGGKRGAGAVQGDVT